MQNPAAIHHYIPIFWTKQWAGDDGRVFRFNKPHKQVIERRVSPSRCFWEKNLYALPGNGPAKQILEEHFFKQLDDFASRSLHKMNHTAMEHLSPEETLGWAAFILSLFHRSPTHLTATKEAAELVWRTPLPELKKRYAKSREDTDPEDYAAYLEHRSKDQVATGILRSLPYLILNDKIARHLTDCHWVKITVPHNEIELLLSDDPLLRTNGIKNPGGHFALPLSPRRLLVIAPDMSTIEQIRRVPIRHLVKQMNSWSVQSAREFVIASDLKQASFIAKHFSTVQRPSIMTDTKKQIDAELGDKRSD